MIDNEIDVLSTTPSITQNKDRQMDMMLNQADIVIDRGEAKQDIPMEAIGCATKGTTTHSNLLDTGPEVSAWKRNATRLGIDLASIGAIQLSHWHRDHSSGMLKAVSMITAAKTQDSSPVIVDLHPSRPNYRGFTATDLLTLREKGCSHGGVVNAARHSLALVNSPITPKIPLYAILGGYHLVGEQEANISQTARDLKELDPKVLLPGHYSGWRAMGEIARIFERGGDGERGVGIWFLDDCMFLKAWDL
ncbi:uncharacterized protein RSE6_04135 [Rhynchosporium secalis]|uniref:Metallo-beta-lactamase domain-containing protein n=1 Tax=Rhynchosporium secalis TaxID=38038 RepID=A0A1E1M4J5_RHYSE|nr:uncharacterized protein RSE6_04135 [Rhynchosporium secalis]